MKSFLTDIRDHETNDNFIDKHWNTIQETIGDLPADEIINRLMSMEIDRFRKAYDNAPDLNVKMRSKKEERSTNKDKGKPRKTGRWSGYQINSGTKHNMNPPRLIALINQQTDSSDIAIGEIVVKTKTTYFEIDSTHSQRLEEAFENYELHGKPVLEKADRRPEPTQRSRRDGGSRRRKGAGDSRRNSSSRKDRSSSHKNRRKTR